MAQASIKLEFRCLDSGTGFYAWRDYTTRYIRSEEMLVEAESDVTGYRAYYPTLSKIYVDNSDRFWDVLDRTSEELGNGADTYRSGFKGRLVRLTTYRGGTDDAQNIVRRYVGAVANLTCQPETPEAEIALVSMQRLAMESKCENEKIEGATAYGDWWTEAAALYASRRQSLSGAYACEWFRHRRAYQVFKRTKLPVTDAAFTADIDNVRLTTTDGRRTAVCVSLPAASTLTPLGFCWGPGTGTTAYVVMCSTAVATDTLYLYAWDYTTGEISLVDQLHRTVGDNLTLAWCGVNYNPNANKLYVCMWSQTGSTGPWTPWLFQYDFALAAITGINMQTWAAALGTAATTFSDFLFFTNCRGTTETSAQGTLWVVLDTNVAGTSSNRIVEVNCWEIIGGPAVINDSLATYRADAGGAGGWPARMALYPAACCERAQANPNAAYVDAVNSPDILIYITGSTLWLALEPGNYVHDYIWRVGIASSAWIAIGAAVCVHHDAGAGDSGFCGWNEMAETAWGLLFTSQQVGTISASPIVGKIAANYGDNDTCTLIEPEFYTGEAGSQGTQLYHNPDAFIWPLDEGSRFVYNYENDRVYYLTAPQSASGYQSWNTRLRSIDASGATITTPPLDENVNPYVAGGFGDAVSDFAYKVQAGMCLCIRYGTDYDVDGWELHGIVMQSRDAPLLMSYVPRFYPSIPLVDLTGLSVWEVRNLIAEICSCVHGYDSNGSLFLKARPSVVPIVNWPDGDLRIQETGWGKLANSIALLPYVLRQSSGDQAANIIQSTIGALSSGALMTIHVGASSDSNQLFRVIFTSATGYSVDHWLLNVWGNIGTSNVNSTFRCEWFSLSPDCWAGVFDSGDSFTFVVFGSLYSLQQLDRMNRIEVRDATSVAKWGDQAVDIDNRFVTRAQAIELLTAALSWAKDPHRSFQRRVAADEIVTLNEVRLLTKDDWTIAAVLVGLRHKLGDPTMVLTFAEY